ncbi:MAG: polyprenyl diphosphate synthase, partial [Nitrospinota bacterium]
MTCAESSQPIDPARLPRHIAIIMDGNGRWARRRMLPRVAGHREGVRAVDRVVTRCRELGVQALTLYSFSSENWRRPREEISALWGLLAEYLERELGRMLREGIRFNTIGHIQDLPGFAQGIVRRAEETTRNEREMVLTLALSYGSRQELVDACRRVAREVRAGRLEPEGVNAEVLEQYLETAGLPPVDLLIRTSGEQRLS